MAEENANKSMPEPVKPPSESDKKKPTSSESMQQNDATRVHSGHKLSHWLATCWADPPRAWREFEERVDTMNGGHWIKTAVGICFLIGLLGGVWSWTPRGLRLLAQDLSV